MADNQQQGQQQNQQETQADKERKKGQNIKMANQFVIDGAKQLLENYIIGQEGKSGIVTAILDKITAVTGGNIYVLSAAAMTADELLKAAPGLNPVAKTMARETLDTFIDQAKRINMQGPQDKVQQQLNDAKSAAQAKGESLKHALNILRPLVSYESMEGRLDESDKKKLQSWVRWMHVNLPEEFKKWEEIKHRIPNEKRLLQVIQTTSEGVLLEEIPAKLHDASTNHKDTYLRLNYIETTFLGEHTLVQTIKDFILGKETPWTAIVHTKIGEFQTKTQAFDTKMKNQVAAAQEAHKLSVTSSTVFGLGFILFLTAFITVITFISR